MMGHIELFLVAVSLAMDAFAVSVIGGATISDLNRRTYFRLSFHFGLFQFLMPIIGWSFSLLFLDRIEAYSAWAAFLMLLTVGGKMIHEGFSAQEEQTDRDISRGWTMISLGVATSIDALAVGVTLGLMNVHFLYPSLVIGITAAFFSVIGIGIGKQTGHFFGNRLYIPGGIILIIIGLKNLL